MNTRCYRCGWNFSMSREAIEMAVANAAHDPKQRVHVEHCPKCRQVIKIPIQQLRRALPPGWTPASRADEPGEPTAEAGTTPTPAIEAVSVEVPEPAAAEQPAPHRRRRGKASTAEEASAPAETASPSPSSKRAAGKSAAKSPAAKKSTHEPPKP